MSMMSLNCSISYFPSSRGAFPHLSFSPPSALCFSGLSEKIGCGDGGGGPCMFPLNRCKTIHLANQGIANLYDMRIQVRHGQGIHNVEGDKNYNAYMKPDYFDAHLTPLGWQEVAICSQRAEVHELL